MKLGVRAHDYGRHSVKEYAALLKQEGYQAVQLAIHLKDFIVNEKGCYEAKLLGEGCMDYSVLKEWLKVHPDMPVLREEMNPLTAKQDLSFMRALDK